MGRTPILRAMKMDKRPDSECAQPPLKLAVQTMTMQEKKLFGFRGGAPNTHTPVCRGYVCMGRGMYASAHLRHFLDDKLQRFLDWA